MLNNQKNLPAPKLNEQPSYLHVVAMHEGKKVAFYVKDNGTFSAISSDAPTIKNHTDLNGCKQQLINLVNAFCYA